MGRLFGISSNPVSRNFNSKPVIDLDYYIWLVIVATENSVAPVTLELQLQRRMACGQRLGVGTRGVQRAFCTTCYLNSATVLAPTVAMLHIIAL